MTGLSGQATTVLYNIVCLIQVNYYLGTFIICMHF